MSSNHLSSASSWLGRSAVLIVVAATLALTPTACSSLSTDLVIGSPTKQDQNADIIAAQVRAEVCASFPYITYDSTIDSEETRKQIDSTNAVLFEVYRCSIQ
jgi:hypothetical protein